MLGIGGALQNPFQHRPPADIHTANVRRIRDGDPSASAKDDQNPCCEPSSSKKKRKHRTVSFKDDNPNLEPKEKKSKKQSSSWIPLGQLIIQSKLEMQNSKSKNGVTYAFLGSSGCGKSTLIRLLFVEELYGKKAAKAQGLDEFIIQIQTQSSKSDAFKDMPKDILIDPKGLDEDNINFCYHMNENYDKKYNFFIMLDDVLEVRHKGIVQRMFLTMRNTNITSLISLQYPKLIPVSIRTSVYFVFFMYFNNDEGTEQAVRGWLSSYLPGKTLREKMLNYRKWVLGEDGKGHNIFMADNLNHKVYRVDAANKQYSAQEMPILNSLEDIEGGASEEKEKPTCL